MTEPLDLDALLDLCGRAKSGDIRQLFYHPTDSLLITKAMEAIPALVARVRELEKEREVSWFDQAFDGLRWPSIQRDIHTAMAEEREACAKLAESYEPHCESCPRGMATAIRARGKP